MQFIADDASRAFPVIGGGAGSTSHPYQMNLWATLYQTDQAPILSTGTYAYWDPPAADPTCPSGWRYLSQSYAHGAFANGCQTSDQYRLTTLNFSCGVPGYLPGNFTSYVSPIIAEAPACE